MQQTFSLMVHGGAGREDIYSVGKRVRPTTGIGATLRPVN